VSAELVDLAQEPELKLAPVNQYATPTYVPKPRRAVSRQPIAPELARQRLLVPAIGLAVGAFLCLGYALLTIGLFAINPQDFMTDVPPPTQAAERAGYFFGLYSVMIVMFVTPLIVAAGTTSMFRGRGRTLAMIGAVTSVLPCNPCCVVGLPFGIWALMVLNQPEVKAAMR
jgi:hypothetical protein